MNRIVWLTVVLGILVTGGAALAAAGGAVEAKPYERILFRSPTAQGDAVVASTGDTTAARVTVTLRRLKPGASVSILLRAGTCKQPSASLTRVLAGTADAAGSLRKSARVVFRGEPVPFSTIADGLHTLSVVVNGRTAACTSVPGMS